MIYNILIGLIVIFTLINNYLKNKVIKRLEYDINILHTRKARHDLECPLLNTQKNYWKGDYNGLLITEGVCSSL